MATLIAAGVLGALTIGIGALFLSNYRAVIAANRNAEFLYELSKREQGGSGVVEEEREPPSPRQLELMQAGINMPLGGWYAACAAATAAAVWAEMSLIGNLLLAGLALFGVPLAFRMYKKKRAASTKTLFAEQLASALPQVASNMRSGMTVERAIRAVGEHMDEPLKTELMRAQTRLAYGDRLSDALMDSAESTGSSDLRLVGIAVAMQQDSGGDLAEVLDRIADKVKSKLSLRRHIKSVTSSAKASRGMLIAMPWVAMLITSLTTSGGMEFWQSFAGTVVIAIVLVIEFIGATVMGKIMNMEID